MAEAQNSPANKRWRQILRIISIILGILLMALGFYNFGSLNFSDPINIILPIYYM